MAVFFSQIPRKHSDFINASLKTLTIPEILEGKQLSTDTKGRQFSYFDDFPPLSESSQGEELKMKNQGREQVPWKNEKAGGRCSPFGEFAQDFTRKCSA